MNHPVTACKNGKLHEMCANGVKIDVVDWEKCDCELCTGDLDLMQLVADDQCLNKDNYAAVMNGQHSASNPVQWLRVSVQVVITMWLKKRRGDVMGVIQSVLVLKRPHSYWPAAVRRLLEEMSDTSGKTEHQFLWYC